MTIKEAQKFILWARKNGVTSLRMKGLSCDLEPLKTPPNKPGAPDLKTDPELFKNDETAQMPSETDMLMWSSPAFDEIVESRKDDTPRN